MQHTNALNLVRIDGVLLNLCHARGMSPENAAGFLCDIKRIHLANRPKFPLRGNPCCEISMEVINETNAKYHMARQRICRIEKAIEKVARGQPHGLSRKACRKDKGEAQEIVNTVMHVLSRPTPETEEDRIADAKSYLIRIREWFDGSQNVTPLNWQNKPTLGISATNREITITGTETDTIEMKRTTTGSISITMKGDLPEVAIQKLKDACEKQKPASEYVEWHGLQGIVPAKLERYTTDYKGFPCLIINIPKLVRNMDTGEIAYENTGDGYWKTR